MATEIKITQKRRWKDMNFGTQKHPMCGICGDRYVVAYYKKGTLQEDVICDNCADEWKYHSDDDTSANGYYEREYTATLLSAIPLTLDAEEENINVEEIEIDDEWYFKDDNDNIYDIDTKIQFGKYDFVNDKWITVQCQVAF
jgi:hypothetical protein